MMQKGICSALLIGMVLLCMSPVPALASRRGGFDHRGHVHRGGHVHHGGHFRHRGHLHHGGHVHHGGHRGGVSVHLGIGVPVVPYYAPRPPVYYHPHVVYAPPTVVYTSPSVVYTAPPAVQPPPAAVATLQILVAPLQADIYVDGRYIGRAEEFPDGRAQLTVSAGSHTVELRFGDRVHTHSVQVGAGSTVVVSDRLG